jgi:hypothetical protein
LHPSDVLQADRGTVRVRNDDRRILFRSDQLIVGEDLPGALRRLEPALGALDVCRGDGVPHVLEANAKPREPGRIELDAYCRQRAAAHGHLSDAGDLGELLLEDGRCRVVHMPRINRVRREREKQDRRVGRVELAVGRFARQVGGQLSRRGVDRGLDVACGAVDVAVEIEGQRDAGRAQVARRGQLGQPGNAPELALERGRNRGGHRLGARAGQLGGDENRGEVDMRQRSDRKEGIRHCACERDGDRQQERPDRPRNEWRGEVHRRSNGGSRRRRRPRRSNAR